MKISVRRSVRVKRAFKAKTADRRAGFVLVEIIVAMILLAIALSSLAALMYSVSQQGMVATANAYKNGVLMEQVNQYEGIPYASVAVGTSTYSQTSGTYLYTRKVTVTEPVVNRYKTITIIITPTNTKFKPDTASFNRTNARVPLTLCTTCVNATP